MNLQQHLEEALERTPHSPDVVHAAGRNLVGAVVDAKLPLSPLVAHAVMRLADAAGGIDAPWSTDAFLIERLFLLEVHLVSVSLRLPVLGLDMATGFANPEEAERDREGPEDQ